MKVEQYLQRIGIDDVKGDNLETLEKLQLQHMLHVPFENLDVINQIPIPLDIEMYYKKIVINNRGGFCYELNGLFNWLLQTLGFKSNLVAAAVKRADGSWTMDTSHACLIVELDQSYLVDVGFGDSVRVPLPLTGEVRKDVSGIYRMKKVTGNTFKLQRKSDQWRTLFRLNSKRRELIEFDEACHYNQTSPKSHFTQRELVSLATRNGRVTLTGDRLVITNKDQKTDQLIDPIKKSTILHNCFNM